jgi:AcrR family transcriptional regulator
MATAKSKRTKSKPGTNAEKKICDVVLGLAARHGWNTLTLEQIAKAAKLSPATMREYFSAKDQILPAIVRQIDREVIAAVGKSGPKGEPHDRLFEVMMARFDALQSHRAGILAILDGLRADPASARLIAPAQWQSMQAMLDLAAMKTGEGPKASLATAGLLGIYYWTLCCWRRDETRDMAKTMAALDRGLRRAGRVAEIIFRAK